MIGIKLIPLGVTRVTASGVGLWYAVGMDKELTYFTYSIDDEDLAGWYMTSIDVDGIVSYSENNETGNRTVVLQPMFEPKDDLDPTPAMRWNPSLEVDEDIFMKTGKVFFKD